MLYIRQENRRKAYQDMVCFFQLKKEPEVRKKEVNCEDSESNRSGIPQIRTGAGGIRFYKPY